MQMGMLMYDGSIEKYSAGWARRFKKQKEESRASAEEARRSLTEAVEILKRHGATKIVLFGSLCSGSLRPMSDIDLAVEGIAQDSWMRALADVLMALDRPIDLKPLEEIEASFREKILQKGEVLYARSGSTAGPGR